jgi:hypothetical protein
VGLQVARPRVLLVRDAVEFCFQECEVVIFLKLCLTVIPSIFRLWLLDSKLGHRNLNLL